MSLKNFDQKVYNYRVLRTIMMTFGSFLIAAGPLYAYFVYSQVGTDGLGDVMYQFISSLLAGPAGIFICITGKRLKEPILKDKEENE